jgi:hypothetical protein
MKTFIFCTSFINHNDIDNNNNRINKWINYYGELKESFDADHLILIDDASPIIDLDLDLDIYDSEKLPNSIKKSINLFRFQEHLGRPSWKDYQGWWRSFIFSLEIAKKYNFEKIIHIESDFYIVSENMIDYIKNFNQGWGAFYSSYHDFPESAIQIICKDAFFKFEDIANRIKINNYRSENYLQAELFLPFSDIIKEFNGDRFGQPEVFDAWLKKENNKKIDYIGQVHSYHKSDYYKTFFDFDGQF